MVGVMAYWQYKTGILTASCKATHTNGSNCLGTPVSARSLKIANLDAEGSPLEGAERVSSIKKMIKKHSFGLDAVL
jgi:hypothetical protein